MSLLNDGSHGDAETAILHQYLTKPELSAVNLNNATYQLYTCDRCYPAAIRTRQTIYCQLHLLKSDVLCEKCKYPTVIRVDLPKSRKSKAFPKQGQQKAIAIWQCQNCLAEKPIYPQAPRVTNTNYNSSNDYGSSSYSSNDTYDYGSSSSDFGGGSSDGGGAGADW
jgi:uncharacterized protein